MRVLFLCLGNICRSPLAEGAMRHLLTQRGITGVEVDSAGTGGWHVGDPPDARSIRVAAEHGVDISHQRARQLVPDDFARFDWIVAMDGDNLATAGRCRPTGARYMRARLVAMRDFLPRDGEHARPDLDGVPDPYYGDVGGFRAVWSLLAGGMPRLLSRVMSEDPE